MTIDGGEVRISLTLDDQASGGLRQADNAILAFAGSTQRAIMSIGRLAPQMALVVTAGLAVRQVVVAYAEYEQKLATVNSVMRGTSDQIKAVGDAQLDLSRKTIFTASQISDATIVLAKAHASAAQAIKELPDALNLASAAMTDTKEAATGLVTATKAFQLSANDSRETANTLAQAADSSVSSFNALLVALKQVGPVANAAHISLRDTTQAIDDLQNSGLQGDSGTALKVFLQRIEHETPAAKQAINELGLSFYNAGGQMKSLADIADELFLKTQRMDDQARNAALTTIFGTRGVRVADVYAEQGSAGIAEAARKQAELGDAASIAARKLDTIQGSFHQLASSANVAAVQIGQGLEPAIRSMADTSKNAANLLTGVIAHTGPLAQVGVGIGITTALYKVMSIAQDALTIKFGTMDQAIAAGVKPVNDRIAALNRFNQIQRESASLAAITAQQELAYNKGQTYNPLAMGGKGGFGAAAAPDEALIVRQESLAQQEDLIRKGALTKDVEAYAARRALYEQNLATHNRLATMSADWDIKEQARVIAQTQALAMKNLLAQLPGGSGKITPNTIKPAQPWSGVVTPVPIEPQIDEVQIKEAIVGKKAKIASGIKAGGLALGEAVMPVMILLAVDQLVIDPAVKSITDAITKGRLAFAQGQVNLTGVDNPGASYEDMAKKAREASDELDKLAKKKKDLEFHEDPTKNVPFLGGLVHTLKLGGDPTAAPEIEKTVALMEQAKEIQDKAIAAQSAMKISAKSEATQAAGDVVQQMKDEGISAEEAQRRFSTYTYALDQNTNATMSRDQHMRDMGLTEKQIAAINRDATQSIEDQRKAVQDLDDQLRQHYADMATQKSDLLDKGAPELLVNRVLYPEDFNRSKDQQIQDKKSLDEFTKKAEETQKAWESARTAFSSVSLSSGIQGLADAAPKLRDANDQLTKVGQHSNAVSELANIAEQFRAVSDEEKKAAAAFDGFELLFKDTGRRIGALDELKGQVDELVNYAQQKKNLGLATPADQRLLDQSGNIYDNIADNEDKLKEHRINDLLNLSTVVPDLVKVDDKIRETANLIGTTHLVVTVEAATSAAENDLQAFIDKVRETTVVAKVVYQYGSGTTTYGPPGGSDSGGGGGEYYGTASGGPAGPPVPPGIGTMTPRGDATALQPLLPYILQAVANQKRATGIDIDPRLVGDIIMHESGGVPGRVEEGGGPGIQGHYGRGLMQVDLGQHTDMQPYEGRLMGTTPADIQFQIDEGVKILADSLRRNGATRGVQGYAGMGYVGPHGEDFPTELANYYTSPVGNAIGFNGGNPNQGGDGSGAGGTYDQRTIDRSETLTQQQYQEQINDVIAPPGGAKGMSGQAILDAAKSHIGEISQIDGEPWYLWCEKFVDNQVEAATGHTFRGKTADEHIRAAEAGVKGAGTVIGRDQARAGDLVGWEGGSPYAGDARGHIGVFEGGDKYIGTTANGIQEREIGPGAVFIRPDGVVAAGPVPGSVRYRYTPTQIANSEALTAQAAKEDAAAAIGTKNYTDPNAAGKALNAKPIVDVTKAARDLNAEFAKMDGKEIANVTAQYDKLLPLVQKVKNDALAPNAPPAAHDQANREAAQETLQIEALMAQAMNEIAAGGTDVAAIFQKIRDTAGPMGDAIVQITKNMAEIKANEDSIEQITKAITAANADWEKTTKSRAAADKAHSEALQDQQHTEAQAKLDEDKANTTAQWKLEDRRTSIQRKWKAEEEGATADRKRNEDAYKLFQQNQKASEDSETQKYDVIKRAEEDKKNTEDDAWRTRSRQFEDQQRYQDHYGSTAKKNLTDQQLLLEAQYKTQTATNNAQEQMLAARAKNADTNEGALSAGAQLAILKDADKQASKNLQDQKDKIKDAMDAEDRLISQEKYDFETQRLTETRKHEDRLNAMIVEGTTASRAHEDTMLKLKQESDAAALLHDQQMEAMDDERATAQKNHDIVTQQWQDDDQTRSRYHTVEQQREAQTALDREKNETTYQRNLAITRELEDKTHTEAINALNTEKDALTERDKKLQEQNSALDSIVGQWAKLTDYAGSTANVLLDALKQYLDASNTPAPAGHARGGILNGLSLVGEDGPEFINATGVATSASDTVQILREAMRVTSQPVAYNAGDRHYHIYQQPGESNEDLVQRIEAMEEKERERLAAERLAVWQGSRR